MNAKLADMVACLTYYVLFVWIPKDIQNYTIKKPLDRSKVAKKGINTTLQIKLIEINRKNTSLKWIAW